MFHRRRYGLEFTERKKVPDRCKGANLVVLNPALSFAETRGRTRGRTTWCGPTNYGWHELVHMEGRRDVIGREQWAMPDRPSIMYLLLAG